jgi:hypothetical protein
MSKKEGIEKLEKYKSLIQEISLTIHKGNLSEQETIDIFSLLLLGKLAVVNPDEAIKLAEVLQSIMSKFPIESKTPQIEELKEEDSLLAKVNFRRKGLGVVKDFWGLDPALITSNH